MIRLLDIVFSFLILILFFPLFILIFFIGFLDTGFPLFIQKRIGLNLMAGYAFYNNFKQLNVTGEAALYYKF